MLIDTVLSSGWFFAVHAVAQIPADDGIVALALRSSFFARLILISLAALSVAAWTITIHKFLQFKTFQREYNYYLNLVTPNVELSSFYTHAIESRNDAFSRIAEEGYYTLNNTLKRLWKHAERASVQLGLAGGNPAGEEQAAKSSFSRELSLRLEAGANTELLKLGSGLSFLATVVSVSPFIGLLGTVWGVLESFLSIGTTGSADLAVVAPGIAEALITTVAGLAVAIPALLCNNYLSALLQKIEDQLDRLTTELNIYFIHTWQHEKTKIEGHFGRQRDVAG